MQKYRIKTTEPVADFFSLEKKHTVYGEVSVMKTNDRHYIIEGHNYIEDENGIQHVIRSKNLAKPYNFKVKKLSYEVFDGLVAQFEQMIEFPEFPTSSDKIDYLALIVMLMINNGQIPDIGETETTQMCGVSWEVDSIQDPEPETLEE